MQQKFENSAYSSRFNLLCPSDVWQDCKVLESSRYLARTTAGTSEQIRLGRPQLNRNVFDLSIDVFALNQGDTPERVGRRSSTSTGPNPAEFDR